VFPGQRGGYVDLHNWRAREWIPALEAAGVPRRRIYGLRHTFATTWLAAGVPIFDVARYMGRSVRMIDLTYGHLAHGSEAAALAHVNSFGHGLATERADAALPGTTKAPR